MQEVQKPDIQNIYKKIHIKQTTGTRNFKIPFTKGMNFYKRCARTVLWNIYNAARETKEDWI